MKEIKSRDNPLIKKVASLQHKKYRDKLGLFLAEGSRTCKTIIEGNIKLDTLFTIPQMLSTAQQFTPEDNIILVSDDVMKKISTATTPSGIVAVFHIPKTSAAIDSGIVLVQLTDAGNVGTLIRTAAAMNFKTIVCIETVDPWNPKVIQSSAGTIAYVDIHQLRWEDLLKNKKNIPLFALVVSEGKSLSEMKFTKGLLVIGSEAHGIPDEWLRDCDEKLTIEMPGNIESLNAAVAGSIAMYMLSRKRRI